MATSQKEIRLLSTSAILGYGFPEASLRAWRGQTQKHRKRLPFTRETPHAPAN